MSDDISITLLSSDNFTPCALDDFQRRQNVRRVYRKINGTYSLIESPYIEDWTVSEKRKIASDISQKDRVTYLAIYNNKVIGFVSFLGETQENRLIMKALFVSTAFRGKGLGRRLFSILRTEATARNASSIYISACSSEETVAFYRAMGAELSKNPIQAIADAKPLDLQMECRV